MAGGRGDDARTGDGAVRVDLGGLPTTFPLVSSRVVRWSGGGLVALGLVSLVLFATGIRVAGQPWIALAQTALGLLAVVAGSSAHVALEPGGFRLGSRLYRGRLRPWAGVDDVDHGNPRWETPAELRGPRLGAGAVPLRGMTVDEAVELRLRLREARVRAEAGA